ncbi:MAG TPA: hypothetical protein VFA22_08775 [Stellaceae bacterium]|nr:hypothetical protein [Stellaceae bacterium]
MIAIRHVLSVLLLLAGCQPLPHPFADSARGPGVPALRPPDSAGVSVLPVTGAPEAASSALAGALAEALRDADVPASTEGSNRGSYRLAASAESRPLGGERVAVVVSWEVRDAGGAKVGSGTAEAQTTMALWQSGNASLATALAGQATPAIVDLVSGEAPLPRDVAAAVRIASVVGAPGDGGTALARAIGTALGRAGVDVAHGSGKARFSLNCEVELAPQADGKQHVRVRWLLLGGDGKPVGQVAQENDVPAGSLDGPWGDIAYAVAGAAAPGIADLIQKATVASAGS